MLTAYIWKLTINQHTPESVAYYEEFALVSNTGHGTFRRAGILLALCRGLAVEQGGQFHIFSHEMLVKYLKHIYPFLL